MRLIVILTVNMAAIKILLAVNLNEAGRWSEDILTFWKDQDLWVWRACKPYDHYKIAVRVASNPARPVSNLKGGEGMDWKEWLIRTKTLLNLDIIAEGYFERFQVWFEHGYSPEKAVKEFMRLMDRRPR
jgi:hypothetical protein